MTTDLTNCDQEPIHIPGKIQNHGFLIAVDKFLNIVACSDNVSSWIPVDSASVLLDKPVHSLDAFFQNDAEENFAAVVQSAITIKGFVFQNPYGVAISGKAFNLIITAATGYFLLEFEPVISDLKSDIQRNIAGPISNILSYSRLTKLLHKSAEDIKQIIGYDRIMIYKFHPDGHGEVVSEVKNEELEPWLGLHYPASDIPRQARELYKINLTRLIANVNAPTSEIIASANFKLLPLDLTNSTLRAVSPIHIQYLKNMGVASSFSISLLFRDELWGLVACHNYSPRFINYKEREACKIIGQVLSSALTFRHAEEEDYTSSRLKGALNTLTRQLGRQTKIEEALFLNESCLLDIASASGVALLFDNKLHTAGQLPDEKFILELIDWVYKQNDSQIFETSRLPLIYSPAIERRKQASGILLCRLSKDIKECIVWFKPEVLTSVNWAGNPEKNAQRNDEGIMQIHPRNSFATWTQTVHHTSVAWSNAELKAVLQLKEEISYAVNRRIAEMRLLNEKLKDAYDELDTFSYTISHDLKNPLTSIKSFSEILTEFYNLEPDAKEIVERIVKSANKMQAMIGEVLNYSRIGQSKLKAGMVSMDKILNEVKEESLLIYKKSNPEIIIGDTPEIYGDATMLMQVFSNLVGNAVKYSSQHHKPVVTINGHDTGEEVKYIIRDNGIGIKPENRDRIFDLFVRLDEAKEYEGSGVGLAIVKKIVEKHEGNIWLESDVNNGTAFYLSFNKHKHEESLV